MNSFKFIIPIIFSFFIYKFIHTTLQNVCELKGPPDNSATDFCADLELRSSSFTEFFSNYFSVKNVFYGIYDSRKMVIKKLRRRFQLNKTSNNYSDLYDKITKRNTNFKICSVDSLGHFLNFFTEGFATELLQINVEPLLLQMLKAEGGWPVPHYLGVCGQCFVELYSGLTLNSFRNADWRTRATLALHLLQAAQNFTELHSDFRFYLTDVSPDNIAVSRDLQVTFVDLENVIVTDKHRPNLNVHLSERYEDIDGFAFSENSICSSSISDHNYYAISKLLLSDTAPWPMMEGGLLHSPPKNLDQAQFHLLKLIRSCSHDVHCFRAVPEIIVLLQNVINMWII